MKRKVIVVLLVLMIVTTSGCMFTVDEKPKANTSSVVYNEYMKNFPKYDTVKDMPEFRYLVSNGYFGDVYVVQDPELNVTLYIYDAGTGGGIYGIPNWMLENPHESENKSK